MRIQRFNPLAAATLTCLATTVACGPTTPPELAGLSDQVAEVGTELDIALNGADHDGARLVYTFKAADVADIAGQAEITVSPDGTGEFRWTPLAADVGMHAFDFTVADGTATTTVTINIDVRSAIGADSAPVFREPLGTGTTVDLSAASCVDVDVVVDDQATANVTIAQEAPLIEGATLTAEGGEMAKWHWCPTAAQAAAMDRYTLVLSADDGTNPKTIKNYLIVVRSADGGSACPGTPPAIAHTPMDQTTNLDLSLTATVTDAVGIKDAPLFYYATTNPGATPDLAAMTQLTMTEASGSATSGTWTAAVPSPVAGMSPGSSVTLYYLFAADDESANGTCEHTTTSQVYSATITAGGADVAGACQSCSDDSQCGAGGECVPIGNMGASYCLTACDAGCGSGFTCSSEAIESVDGASAQQCVPVSGSCVAPTAQCADDTWEVDDTRSDASHNPTMTPGDYDLVSCPSTTDTTSANEDWYKIVLSGDARVDLDLLGDGATDLDLHLYHSDGTVVTASTSSNADEEIDTCLPAATYYVKVNGYGHARSVYTLDYAQSAASCDTSCVDDAYEEDNTYSQARDATELPYTADDDMICPNDDDWYHVLLFTGQTMTVDLTFEQDDESGNLDLHLYSDGTTDLTPCGVDDPEDCSVAAGQGDTSNEHTAFTAPDGCDDGCDYYVVVRGFDGATNSYAIAIDAQ
jgi:hypothetical protein